MVFFFIIRITYIVENLNNTESYKEEKCNVIVQFIIIIFCLNK